MANSFSYNGVDLSTYDLKVTGFELPIERSVPVSQLQDRGLTGLGSYTAKQISLEIVVTGSSFADLKANLDYILGVLNSEKGTLILDALPDRYWTTDLVSFEGEVESPVLWRGKVGFIAADPHAADVSLTSTPNNVDADPFYYDEAAGGTAKTDPVYTLIVGAGDAQTPATLVLQNITTGMALEWEDDVSVGDVLEINCENWTVYHNGVESMATVIGEFPYLIPGTNSLMVAGWLTHGSMTTDYRNRYV